MPLVAGAQRGWSVVDGATQRWVRATGRLLDLADHQWLDGPTGAPEVIGETWISSYARSRGARAEIGEHEAGLLACMSALDGDGFSASALDPVIVDFYEHTARWRLEAWSRWSPVFRPFGWGLSALFARRLQQLNLPLDALAVSRGMTSRVVPLRGADGRLLGTAWQRTLRSNGDTVFGGYYGVHTAPLGTRPSVRVVFPLPNGSVTVFLRPEVTPRGHLRLVSPPGPFGADGAYLLVRRQGSRMAWVRRIPLPESFHVFVDEEGVLRADHRLCLYRAEVLRFHYRLEPRGGLGRPAAG